MLNKKQELIVKNGINHIRHNKVQVYEYTGYAGTGKTYVLHKIIEGVGIPLSRIAAMAYIGQAAIVMRVNGLWNARTIHSWTMELVDEIVVDEHGNPIIDKVYNKPKKELVFRPRPIEYFRDIDYIIIDEAYTVPIEMKQFIERLGKPIIACGDWGQLPPVKSTPAYLTNRNIDCLDELVRQDANGGIAYVSYLVRKGIPLSPGYYGNVLVIEEKDLTLDMIKASQILICGKNKTRDFYNSKIREEILRAKTRLPGIGEKLICRKNNWAIERNGISLANGLIGRVSTPTDITRYDGRTFTIDFTTDLLNIEFPNIVCDYKYFLANHEERQWLKNSKYSTGEKMEYAYAITTHLSQGAQYDNGIYIQEYLRPELQDNLNYVGASRFKKFLIYVIPNRVKRFFF